MSIKKIFLITVLSLMLFLLAPINNAKAAEYACVKKSKVSRECINVPGKDFDEATTNCLAKCKNETGFTCDTVTGACYVYPAPDAPSTPASTQAGCKIENGQEICSLENPLAGNKVEAAAIISTAIKAALGIMGALTLLMLVWGGFQWLTSAGNPEKVKMGTQTMVWAIIGVVLVFASYLLLSTFTSYLTGTP